MPQVPNGNSGSIPNLVTSKATGKKGRPARAKGKKRKRFEDSDESSDEDSIDRYFRGGYHGSFSQSRGHTFPSMASMVSTGQESPKRIKRVQALLDRARKPGDAMPEERLVVQTIPNNRNLQVSGSAPVNHGLTTTIACVMSRSSRGG